MLTIKTSIIEHGTFREKLWNVLDKIYNPALCDFMKKIYNEYTEIKENNEFRICLANPYAKDDTVSVLHYDKMPELIMEERNSTYGSKYNIWFEYVPAGYTEESGLKKRYPVLVDNMHYVYLVINKDEDDVHNASYMTYLNENTGWICLDNVIYDENNKKFLGKFNMPDVKKWLMIVLDAEKKKQSDSMKSKYRFICDCGHYVWKFMHTIDSSILCLRFPFLYTHNRWDDKHYHNFKILEYVKKLLDEARMFVDIKWFKDESKFMVTGDMHEFEKHIVKETDEYSAKYLRKELLKYNYVYRDGSIVYELYNAKSKTYNIVQVVRADGSRHPYIYDGEWTNVTNYIEKRKGDLDFDHDDYISKHRTIVFDAAKLKRANMLMWLHDHILAVICGIPTGSELDDLDEGWRRVFGIQICKDIRMRLWQQGKFKALFGYRISQIKEKFGGLRWYDNGDTFDIISKYEDISYKTCISCGRPAKYITRGWICPYCEECIGENKENARLIGKNDDSEEENEEYKKTR